MTDPRIEAAARAICEYAHECEGESVQWHEITEALRGVSRRYALRALEAADAAAWRPMSEAPRDGTVIEIFQGNRGAWKGIGIATAQYWTPEKLAALDGSSDATDYEGTWYLASNFWGDAEDETNPWLWRPHMPPSVEQQAKGLDDIYTGATPAPYPAPETITIPEVRNDRPIEV